MVGQLTLSDGVRGNVVLVGEPQNEKGAVLMTAGPDGSRQVVLLASVIGRLHPQDVVDILCMQERCFGKRGLLPPEDLSG